MAESIIEQANELLRTKGIAPAIEFLGHSPLASSAPAVAMLHELLWTHRKTLPESLLSERFLDPHWCRCTVCAREWVPSPMLMQAEMPVAAAGGVTCVPCDRVLCAPCYKAGGSPRCPAGHPYTGIRRPNGRRPRERVDPDAELLRFQERLPDTSVGIDPTFPQIRSGTSADHLTWTETLLDAGLHDHAGQQLKLSGEPASDDERARQLWLRARLFAGDIARMLDEATALAPDRGEIWLTAAEFPLEDRDSKRMPPRPIVRVPDPRALVYAENARARLGDTPRVRLAYGRALRACGRPSEALAFLEGGELREAMLEARCQSEPVDVDAHWQLAWIYQRGMRFADARRLFTKLRDHFPDRAEGYCGLAMLDFVDYDRPVEERYERAYALCREALARDANLGATYEVLGLIFESIGTTHNRVTFPVGDPLISYRRALELDPDRDVALEAVAEAEIDAGKIDPALELLERGAALGTRIDSVYRKLAIIYRGKREFEKEDRSWRRANELAPGLRIDGEYADRILRLCGFEY